MKIFSFETDNLSIYTQSKEHNNIKVNYLSGSTLPV